MRRETGKVPLIFVEGIYANRANNLLRIINFVISCGDFGDGIEETLTNRHGVKWDSK